ncbi:hypothetical protein IFO70_02380 [Phormidium tenue FACHB-886]|nr:hypothetical protein [Phormidium tenue FACHB-886]
MESSENIQIGARVRVLAPDYAAGEIGAIVSQEISQDEVSDRWIIQLESEDVILSLYRDEFQILD